MFDNALYFFRFINSVEVAQENFRRKHVRYRGLHADIIIENHACAIHDWDMNGVAFETTPDIPLTVGEEIQMVLKFYLPNDTVVVVLPAYIVRAAERGISAAKFLSLQLDVRRQFERVLDSLNTQILLESQAA